MVKSFEYQTATISYTIEGKGKPVVLLHGFGEDSKIWNLQVSFLKEYCLLIVPDLPGSGKSSLLFRESPVVSNEYSTDNSLLSTHDSRLCRLHSCITPA
jgi:pimeloyl-ACP methyl ester carboxylesterase